MKKVKIGSCILFKGDCLKILPKFPDQSMDLILCDLPYGTTGCAWDSTIPMDTLWLQYNRLVHERAAIVLTGQQPFTSLLISSNLKQFRYCWLWEKHRPTGFQHAKHHPLKQHEDIAVFSIKLCLYYPQGLIRINKNIKKKKTQRSPGIMTNGISLRDKDYIQEFTNYPKSILRLPSDNSSQSLHPTQKPVDLMKYLIKTYTLEDQRVLDNCMGSGTTGVACVQTNRKFVGIELNNEYFDIACDRINDAHKEYLRNSKQNLFRRK